MRRCGWGEARHGRRGRAPSVTCKGGRWTALQHSGPPGRRGACCASRAARPGSAGGQHPSRALAGGGAGGDGGRLGETIPHEGAPPVAGRGRGEDGPSHAGSSRRRPEEGRAVLAERGSWRRERGPALPSRRCSPPRWRWERPSPAPGPRPRAEALATARAAPRAGSGTGRRGPRSPPPRSRLPPPPLGPAEPGLSAAAG